MKKKVLFTTFNLDIGGIETSLINLVNNFDFDKYDVTIMLQQKEGLLLGRVNERVNVVGYDLSKMKFTLLRKAVNLMKLIKIFHSNRDKYDFAACYGTGYTMSARLALAASNNNAIWMHTNIVEFVKNQDESIDSELKAKKAVDKFLKESLFKKFKKYFFVSNNAMNAYVNLYPEEKSKSKLCYNIIDYKKIINSSKENPKDIYKKNMLTFINVSRHTEYDKRLSRIINAVERLKNEGYKFRFVLIGDGQEHEKYIDMIENKGLNDIFKVMGAKPNPFPYMLKADAFVMCSAFEGFPTTFTEAMTLNIPLITTNVSDSSTFIDGKYGIVVSNDDGSIYYGMKKFIENGFEITKPFDPTEFNKIYLDRIYDCIEGYHE